MIFEEEGEEIIVRVTTGLTAGIYLVRVENGVAVAYNAYHIDGDYVPDYSRRVGRFDGRRIILDERIVPSESVPSSIKTAEFGVSM